MYDLAKITEEFYDIIDCYCKVDYVKKPILLNGRLTRCLGRVSYFGDEITKVEFSKSLLETATDESIASIIAHEAAHFIAFCETGINHGHDSTFKAICKRIGCKNDTMYTKVERTVETKSVYKYQVYCATCEDFVGNYNRMSKTLKMLEYCHCGRCGGKELSLVQNW